MTCAVENRPGTHWIDRAVAAPLVTLVRWYRLSQERAVLRDMSSERLEDIGVTRTQARREAMRPFWDASFDR